MKTQLVLISAFVLSSFAGVSLAEAGAPPHSVGQTAVDAAKAAAPVGAKAITDAAGKASAAKDTVLGAPAAIQEQAQEKAKEAVPTPADAKAAVEDAGKIPQEVGKAIKHGKDKLEKSAADPVKLPAR